MWRKRKPDDAPIEDVIGRFDELYREEQRALGKFNLAVFGKTGVGKSTLVNTMFADNVARTGNGRPVTAGLDYFAHPSGFFGVFDSAGIQTGDEGDEILEGFRELVTERRSRPIEDQIHVAWYCVRWSDRRFEDSQAEFVRALSELGLPVLFVMTQVPLKKRGEPHPEALEFAEDIVSRGLPLAPSNRVFLTMAAEDRYSGHRPHGLRELLDATFTVAPEGVAAALTAAQQIDVERKAEEARKLVRIAAAGAGLAGAVPVPLVDAAALGAVQIGLMAKIAARFGLDLKKDALLGAVAGVIGGGGAPLASRYLVTSLMKFVPGGNVTAGVMRAGVGSTLTYALGEAWILVCTELYKRGPTALSETSTEEIRKLFIREFKRRAKRGAPELSGAAA